MNPSKIFTATTSDKIYSVSADDRPQHIHNKKCVETLFDDGYTPSEISQQLKIPVSHVREVVTGLVCTN
jgi:hypothetical protein